MLVQASGVVVSLNAEAERGQTVAACLCDKRTEEPGTDSLPPPGQRHPHAHFRCLGVDEGEAGVATAITLNQRA